MNYLSFLLKEGNTFELAKLVYASSEQDGLTRYFDKLLEKRINEMKADDFTKKTGKYLYPKESILTLQSLLLLL